MYLRLLPYFPGGERDYVGEGRVLVRESKSVPKKWSLERYLFTSVRREGPPKGDPYEK